MLHSPAPPPSAPRFGLSIINPVLSNAVALQGHEAAVQVLFAPDRMQVPYTGALVLVRPLALTLQGGGLVSELCSGWCIMQLCKWLPHHGSPPQQLLLLDADGWLRRFRPLRLLVTLACYAAPLRARWLCVLAAPLTAAPSLPLVPCASATSLLPAVLVSATWSPLTSPTHAHCRMLRLSRSCRPEPRGCEAAATATSDLRDAGAPVSWRRADNKPCGHAHW